MKNLNKLGIYRRNKIMAIQFKDSLNEKVENLRNEYLVAAREGAESEVVEAKQGDYMAAYSEALKADIIEMAKKESADANNDLNVKLARGNNVLTAKERQFFTNLVEDDADYDGYKKKELLPETTVERVFEDMQAERPLLSKINFNISGINTRLILADPEGQAVWGEIFGKIQGQISANFREVNFSQNKLTAFAIVPKDLKQFGPEWVERFVRLQLAEAIGLKVEEGVVKGGGSAVNQPVGLTKDLTKDGEGNITGVTDKASSGSLTFKDAQTTARELANVMTYHSTKENGRNVNVAGQVTLVVNPADQFLVQAQHTIQTQNGAWVTSLPFNIDVVASEFVDANKVISVVGSRYTAVHTGNVEIKSYDQTLALEDCDVYISKHFAHGMPEDNKVSAIYDLAIGETPVDDGAGA